MKVEQTTQGIMARRAPKAMTNEGLAGNHGKSYDERREGIPAIKSEFCTPVLACIDCAGISGMTAVNELHPQLWVWKKYVDNWETSFSIVYTVHNFPVLLMPMNEYERLCIVPKDKFINSLHN